ncbi:MAG: 4-(cytidine 5'-diphospho)-2-C-methyl-D-erythritol kinase [Caldisericia bacterium]|nr:4-(cytidine 5'-diphospho)-2-C-methyl-D-erythritol kinase [Caldisericia bacterium]
MQASFRCSAKINWDLYITGLLENGFHALDSIVAPIDLFDDIDICISNGSGIEVLCDISPGQNNLAWKAADRFLNHVGRNHKIVIKITKGIPSGAGLGGGSSDAACVIKSLNEMLNCKLDREKLKNIAETIGSDVPCFIHDGWRRMTGRGEIVEDFTAPNKHIALAIPDKPVSTALSYKKFDENPEFLKPRKDRLENPFNALEEASISIVPEIKEVLELLSSTGAKPCRMTGSGSACFGVYETKKQADTACLQMQSSKLKVFSLSAGF